MNLQVFIEIFTSWEVLAVLVLLLGLFPLLFTIASLDKSPVKIKKVPAKKSSGEGGAAADKGGGGGESEEDKDDEPDGAEADEE